MLPHNEIEEVDDQRMRRYRILIYVGFLSFLVYALNIPDQQQQTSNTSDPKLCPSLDYETEILSYLLNQERQPAQQCFVQYFSKIIQFKHFKGELDGTYAHLHFYKQIKEDGLDINLIFSNSPYFDDPMYTINFNTTYTHLNNSYDQEFQQFLISQNASISYGDPFSGTKNDSNLYMQQEQIANLSIIITNVTQPDVKFEDQVIIKIIVESTYFEQKFILMSQVVDKTFQIESSAILYSVFNSALCIICMIVGLQILKSIIEGDDNAEEYSLITLGFIMIQDFYLCFLNFFQAMISDTLFQYFISLSFLYFIMFSIFEMRIIMIVWKQRLNPANNFRWEVIKFYLILYTSIFIVGYFIYSYIIYSWMTVFMTFYLFPQIIHQAYRGQHVKLNVKFNIVFILPRILMIVYFRGFPLNILNLKPMPLLCLLVIISYAVQLIIVDLQHRWGPQFIIPAFLLPKKYNYFVKIPQQIDLEIGAPTEFQYLFQEECSICMGPLHQNPTLQLTSEEEQNHQISRVLQKQRGNIMRTPCDHKFHLVCLVKWMTIKLNCPSCRNPLPPL